MHKEVISYLLILIVCFSSCIRKGQEQLSQLSRAEEMMELYPDSALACLDSFALQYGGLTEEAQMYHALLTIKAKDKLYVLPTSDSLINRVVAFYEEADNPRRLVEAYYLQGGTYRDLEDAPRAIAAYQRAADLGKEYANDTLNGRIYGQMATVFAYQDLYEASMEASQEAYRYQEACNHYSGMAYTLRNMARIHDMLMRKDSAELYYRKAYHLMYDRVSPMKACGIGNEFAGVLLDYKKVDSAFVWINKVRWVEESSLTPLILAQVYYELNQLDSAAYYSQKVLQGNSIHHTRSAYRILVKIAEKRKDYKQAYYYSSQCVEALDSIRYITRTDAVKKTYSLYNYNIAERKNKQLELEASIRNKLLLQMLVVILGLFVVVLILAYLIRRRKEKHARREAFLQSILQKRQSQSDEQITENERQISVLKEKLCSVVAKNDELSRELLEAQTRSLQMSNEQVLLNRQEEELRIQLLRQSDIYLHFHQVKESKELSQEHWAQLADAINAAYPDFTNRLYTLYPHLSELELRVCYLTKINMKRGRISELTDRAPSTITNTFTRLYQKIYGVKGTPQQMDELIQTL